MKSKSVRLDTLDSNHGVGHNRIVAVALHKCNKSATKDLLKPLKRITYRAVKGYIEVSSVDDRVRNDQPHETKIPEVVKAVATRIRRNLPRKQKIMAREMKIPSRIISCFIKQDLGFGAYRRITRQRLTRAVSNRNVM
ncbi:hypothetical protein Trydic_g15222 [Trypoxylus dichotomus]